MSRPKSMPRTGCCISCTWARASQNPPATRSLRICVANASTLTRFAGRLHTQRHYVHHNPANAAGKLLVTEKLADRAVALPFHRHLTEQQIAFIVSTLKDASTNVGAGAAIF